MRGAGRLGRAHGGGRGRRGWQHVLPSRRPSPSPINSPTLAFTTTAPVVTTQQGSPPPPLPRGRGGAVAAGGGGGRAARSAHTRARIRTHTHTRCGWGCKNKQVTVKCGWVGVGCGGGVRGRAQASEEGGGPATSACVRVWCMWGGRATGARRQARRTDVLRLAGTCGWGVGGGGGARAPGGGRGGGEGLEEARVRVLPRACTRAGGGVGGMG